MPRKLPQKLPSGKTENRSPYSVQVHRDNRHVDALDDALHAAPERQHLPDARHLPFRENAYQLAVLQRLRGFAQRVNHLARALIRSNGNHAQHFRERLDQRMLVRSLEHQKAHGTIQRRNQKCRIRHRHVVRHQQRPALRRNPLAPHNIKPVKRMRRCPQQQPDQGIRQQVQHIPGSRQRCYRGPKKNRSRAQVQPMRHGVIRA